MVRRRVRVVWLGDSLDVLSSFSDEAKFQLGKDLERMQNGERPLDYGSMAPVLPGVIELRDEDKDFWYRIFCLDSRDVVFVLHCFRKTTNQTSTRDVELGRARLKLAQEIVAEKRGEQDMAKSAKSISHISYGSVLDDLDIAPGKLASFKLRAELHANIIKVASRYSQADLQELLNESHPRVSDFLRGKVTKFSLETLVEYAERLGMRPQIKTEAPRKPREMYA